MCVIKAYKTKAGHKACLAAVTMAGCSNCLKNE